MSSLFRNLLLTISLFNGLLTEPFASKTVEKVGCLFVGSYVQTWEVTNDIFQLVVCQVCNLQTSMQRLWNRGLSCFIQGLHCGTVSKIQPDIFKSGKSYTKLNAPLMSELIWSHKVNPGVLYWLHIPKLWSYTSSLLVTLPITTICKKKTFSFKNQDFSHCYSLLHMLLRGVFPAVITFIPQRNWDVC